MAMLAPYAQFRESGILNSILCAMSRIAKDKNGFAPKVCVRCGLEFEWRKKWAKNWNEVKYCSERCRENK
jgi:hypothetical protein